jgi:hypothetical protein
VDLFFPLPFHNLITSLRIVERTGKRMYVWKCREQELEVCYVYRWWGKSGKKMLW